MTNLSNYFNSVYKSCLFKNVIFMLKHRADIYLHEQNASSEKTQAKGPRASLNKGLHFVQISHSSNSPSSHS